MKKIIAMSRPTYGRACGQSGENAAQGEAVRQRAGDEWSVSHWPEGTWQKSRGAFECLPLCWAAWPAAALETSGRRWWTLCHSRLFPTATTHPDKNNIIRQLLYWVNVSRTLYTRIGQDQSKTALCRNKVFHAYLTVAASSLQNTQERKNIGDVRHKKCHSALSL